MTKAFLPIYLTPDTIASLEMIDRLKLVDPCELLEELVENDPKSVCQLMETLLELISNQTQANAPEVFLGKGIHERPALVS